jgi:hypothetical protein
MLPATLATLPPSHASPCAHTVKAVPGPTRSLLATASAGRYPSATASMKVMAQLNALEAGALVLAVRVTLTLPMEGSAFSAAATVVAFASTASGTVV